MIPETDSDTILPYDFDLLWDLKTVGELRNKFLLEVSIIEDIKEAMRNHNITIKGIDTEKRVTILEDKFLEFLEREAEWKEYIEHSQFEQDNDGQVIIYTHIFPDGKPNHLKE